MHLGLKWFFFLFCLFVSQDLGRRGNLVMKPPSAESLKLLHHGYYYTMAYWSSAASQDQTCLDQKRNREGNSHKSFSLPSHFHSKVLEGIHKSISSPLQKSFHNKTNVEEKTKITKRNSRTCNTWIISQSCWKSCSWIDLWLSDCFQDCSMKLPETEQKPLEWDL